MGLSSSDRKAGLLTEQDWSRGHCLKGKYRPIALPATAFTVPEERETFGTRKSEARSTGNSKDNGRKVSQNEQLEEKSSKSAGKKDLDSTETRKIAWAITVSKDGPFVDGAGVLRESILAANAGAKSGSILNNGSTLYSHHFVAFAHETNASKAVAPLRRLGWSVLRKPLPVQVRERNNKMSITSLHCPPTIIKEFCAAYYPSNVGK